MIILQGIGASHGLTIGNAYILASEMFFVPKVELREEDISGEIARFTEALEKTCKEIAEIRRKILQDGREEEAQLFDSQLLALKDPAVVEKTIEKVKKEKLNIDHIFSRIMEELMLSLRQSPDFYFRDRVDTFYDAGRHLLRNLMGREIRGLTHLKEEVIVVAHDLSPSDTALMYKSKVIGFVTDAGSRVSHTAIISRGLEIPAVVGLKNVTKKVSAQDTLIVDGTDGTVVINPNPETLEKYTGKQARLAEQERKLRRLRRLPAQTVDGHTVRLMANIDLPEELPEVVPHGGEGIGLYRTEFLYMNRIELPDEEDQYYAYRCAAERIAPGEVIIRTLDLGGDKFPSRLAVSRETNPFLGCRGIRLSLERPDLFKIQLRAILRAGVYGRLSIMFPLITGLGELVRARELLEEAKEELTERKTPFDGNIRVGIMIETVSAALISDVLAKEVDFFSIGTNDLVQYTLAVDRVNERISHMYQPAHPSILHLIDRIVQSAHSNNIRVGMCGEMASEPIYTPILIGLGIDELSMSPVALPIIKKVVRSIKLTPAKNLLRDVLKLSTAREVVKMITDFMKKSGGYDEP